MRLCHPDRSPLRRTEWRDLLFASGTHMPGAPIHAQLYRAWVGVHKHRQSNLLQGHILKNPRKIHVKPQNKS